MNTAPKPVQRSSTDSPPSPSPSSPPQGFPWRKWLAVATVLLATHAASAAYYAYRYQSGVVGAAGHPLTLGMSFDEWAAATEGADSSSYLRVAQRVAEGSGVVIQVPHADPPRVEPFYYWGPGAPVVLGWWLRLVGGQTMLTFFWFAVASQAFFGIMAIATAALYTRNGWALALVAFGTGFCPPLQNWFYGINLTSSEIVSLLPLSMLFFALAKGFLVYRAAPELSWLRFWRARTTWWVVTWFGLAGLLIGLHSLARDSGAVFATFLACFLLGRAILADRRRFSLAVTTAAVLLVGVYAVRQPVRIWNLRRINNPVVCTSSQGCIWRYGLWFQHDKYDWYETTGIGMGEYLDPAAAPRVEQYYVDKKPHPELFSLGQLICAVAARPGDALAFKASRLPVLWLGTDRWPLWQFGLTPVWCGLYYVLLVTFVVVQWWRGQRVPEILYLHLLLILCAAPLIHFEFRYTFPIWNTLVLVPGLLVATLRPSVRVQVSVGQPQSKAATPKMAA